LCVTAIKSCVTADFQVKKSEKIVCDHGLSAKKFALQLAFPSSQSARDTQKGNGVPQEYKA